jgi:pimeloyl-ACP methyl ester carboxylesterase
MVNWYRAIARYRPQPSSEAVSTPTLILWGTDDEFLETSMAHDSLDYCEDGQLQLVDEATHWILHEEPALVVEALLDHLPDPVRQPDRP